MTRPTRVLQVLSGLGMGGAETWLMQLLRHWRPGGEVQVDFLLTGGREDVFDSEAAALGAKLHYVSYGRSQLGSFVSAFRKLLARGRYDAIHDHADYAGGWRYLMGAGVLPPVRVSHVHNPWLHIEANYAVSPARRIAALGGKALVERRASHVCGTSGQILRQYGFEPGRRRPDVQVLHCGIDLRRFEAPRQPDRSRLLAEFGWPEDAKVILFAGRLDRALEFAHPQNHKNSWLALNIARSATERDPSVRLIMAGTGPSHAALEDRVRSWGLQDRLRLPGLRQDMPALMRASDVLLFPSAQEGLGMVAVEAQAAGLPVVASTAVPREAVVIPELFRALPLDAPREAWAEAVLAAAGAPRPDPARCRNAVEASDFSIANSARRLEAIYRSKS